MRLTDSAFLAVLGDELDIFLAPSAVASIALEKSALADVSGRHSSAFQESIDFPIATRASRRERDATMRTFAEERAVGR